MLDHLNAAFVISPTPPNSSNTHRTVVPWYGEYGENTTVNGFNGGNDDHVECRAIMMGVLVMT